MSEILLDLDTLVVRPKIAIDGLHYEILSPDEVPVITSHRLAAKGKRMEALMGSANLSKAGEAELEKIVLEISDIIMGPIPAEVRARLSEAQRMSVTEAFSTLLLAKKAGTAAALVKSLLPETKTPTGESTQRGSSGSTEDRPTGGSTKRRSRS